MFGAAIIGGVTAVGLVLAIVALAYFLRHWLQQRRMSEDVEGYYAGSATVRSFPRGRRGRWQSGGNEGFTSKGYGEIGKGPDRPARSRPAGKPGMCNRSDKFHDWKNEHLTNRIAGRRDAHKVARVIVRPAKGRKPKPR